MEKTQVFAVLAVGSLVVCLWAAMEALAVCRRFGEGADPRTFGLKCSLVVLGLLFALRGCF